MDDLERSPTPTTPSDAARAGDADREIIAGRLRSAAGEGRIDVGELDERLGRALIAKTYGQLRALVEDLPGGSAPVAPAAGPLDPETLVLKTTAASLKQSGRWPVPKLITAETKSGWITIDFTEAACTHPEVVVEAVNHTGWIRLILPAGWAARIGPSSTNTSHISNKAAHTPDPGAPTLIVTGHPVFGYIRIKQRRRRKSR